MARRRGSSRRRRGRLGFLYKLLTMMVICVAIVLALTLFFKVDTIAVTGEEQYSSDQILEASGVKQGENLFLLNKYEIANQIVRQLPYIEEVRINRRLPDTLLIDVTECSTVFSIRQDGTTWLVSAAGKIVGVEGADGTLQTEPDGSAEPEPDTSAVSSAAGSTATDPAPGSSAAPAGSEAAGGASSQQEGGETGTAASTMPEVPVKSYPVIDGCELLAPSVGTKIALSTDRQTQQSSLLSLLSVLEEKGLTGQVQAIHLDSLTELVMDYAGRFSVRLPYGGDYTYLLDYLEKVVDTLETNETGTLDLTKEGEAHFLQD